MIELYFIDQCPARLCRALARVLGTLCGYGHECAGFAGKGNVGRHSARQID